MKIMTSSVLAAVAAFAFLLAGPYATAEVVVVANKSAPVRSLNIEQVKSIFLKKTDTFPDGTPVVAVDLPYDNEVREEFYQKAVNKRASQVKSYWAKRVFTGKGSPNNTKKNDSAVKRWVASGANRLGYIDANSVDGSVKVMLRLP